MNGGRPARYKGLVVITEEQTILIIFAKQSMKTPFGRKTPRGDVARRVRCSHAGSAAGALLTAWMFAECCATGATFPQYSSRLWQTENGLPHDVANCICQTRDGYLWVGTRRGLARFNGVAFDV